LRWWEQSGNLLLWGSERIEQERKRAEQERERAEQERERAEQAERRVERMAAQLKAMGIDVEAEEPIYKYLDKLKVGWHCPPKG
jgi:hypothetical protein